MFSSFGMVFLLEFSKSKTEPVSFLESFWVREGWGLAIREGRAMACMGMVERRDIFWFWF